MAVTDDGEEFVSLSDDDDDDVVSLVVDYDGNRSHGDFLGAVFDAGYRNVDPDESDFMHFDTSFRRRGPIRYMRRKKIPQAKAWDDDEAKDRTEWVALDKDEWERRTTPPSATCLTPGCENPTTRRTPRDCCDRCHRYQHRNNGQWPNIIQGRTKRRAKKDIN